MELIQTIRDAPFFTEKVTLEGKEYTFVFEWNQRHGWYLGMRDAEGTTLFDPRKLVLSWDLLRAHRWNPDAPQGSLFAFDRSLSDVKPGFLDLATSLAADDGRVQIIYLTEAERLAFSA